MVADGINIEAVEDPLTINFSNLAQEEQDENLREEMRQVLDLAEAVKQQGGRALVVGGFVRDQLLGLPSKDLDVEVYGIELEKLKGLLAKVGEVNKVGESFAVFKLGSLDISIPRKDSKTGQRHRDFDIAGDPSMSFEEASRRRDFTINALALDPLTGEVMDAHGGIQDIKNKSLLAVDEKTFGDDPLRALRAVQLAARLEFQIDERTRELCSQQELGSLSPERIGEEWKKLLLKAEKPSSGLEFARALEIIDKLHPELSATFDTPQEPAFHPEGTVWEHTKIALDNAAKIAKREGLGGEDKLVLMLATLCHDLGKPPKTYEEDGRIRSRGHQYESAALAKSFMNKLFISAGMQKRVLPLIREHMFPYSVQKQGLTDRAIRRLAVRLEPSRIRELLWLVEADWGARGERSMKFEQAGELLARAEQLGVGDRAPKPLVTGQDLIKAGMKQGKELGEKLKQLYEAQLDGEFESKEQGIDYLKKN